jgi:hypothetical protein
LAVHIALLLPGGVKRGDVLVHEAAKGIAKLLVFGAEKGAFNHEIR